MKRYIYFRVDPHGYGVWDREKFYFVEFCDDPIKVIARVHELNEEEKNKNEKGVA